MASPVRMTISEVHALCMRGLIAHKLNFESAHALANVITAAERDGCRSHGLFRLPHYIDSLRYGLVDPETCPKLLPSAGSAVRVDAQKSFGALAWQLGLPQLVSKARQNGIAAYAVYNVFHYSALWHEMEDLAKEGLVGMAFLNSKSFVAHHGGSSKIYGTNPMAFGFPRGPDQPPVVFDQASAVMARGDIMMKEQQGDSIPPGCALDAAGNPTTDPAAALEGAQLTFGGAKGSNIALMVELMAAGLTGMPWSYEARQECVDQNSSVPTRNGEFVIAINPEMFGGTSEDTTKRLEELFEHILADPGTRLPSQRRYSSRQISETEGIDVDSKIHQAIMDRIQTAEE
ncbi:hypothetical protein CYMTET_31390 [Cymbomonas tetramitiformis]|uniref:Uncharacterized protein n=1 Tax=Cymbomonas tetramitiformis TaxID=36881 RepID=A0AAE0FHL4_9CHLO|nr:hypothetical protein CYMTET_31390 [Cymbomonas tetramitiformis]